MRKQLLFIFASFILLIAGCTAQNDEKKLEPVAEKMQAGEYEAAKKDIEKFLSKNKKSKIGWILSGHIYAELDEDSLAIISYEKALAIDHDAEEALTGLGIVFRKQQDYDKAAAYYYRAIKVNPGYAQAYSSLVTIELKRKNFNKAVELGQKAFDLDKEDPVIAANLSVAYHYAGDSTKRDKYYKIAESLGYKSLEKVKQIFAGEFTIFDD